jgi:hypothetical protein
LAFSRRKEKAGRGPHGSERRGWRRVGLAGGQVPVGGRPAAGPGRRRRPKRGGGGVGQEEGRGRAQGGEMGSGPAKGQGPRGWWAGPEAADEQ